MQHDSIAKLFIRVKFYRKTTCHQKHTVHVTHNYTHTHTYTFNSPFSGTTQVSRHQTGKTNLDFTEAKDSDWQWHQLGHMQVCTSLQTDNHTSTPPLSFLQAGCPSCRPTNSNKTQTRVITASPSAQARRFQNTISATSRHSSIPVVPDDLQGARYDFLLVFYIDLRSRWKCCQVSSQ